MVKLKFVLVLFILGVVTFDHVEPREFNDFFDNLFGKYRRPVYRKLTINRKIFFYWDESYTAWSNWTVCDPMKCVKSRYRTCKDNSWQEYVSSFKTEIKCPVKVLLERTQCNDTIECQPVKQNLTAFNATDLKNNCGIRPKTIKNKIVGGADAPKNSWPWHMGIYAKGSMYFCGGTLINSNWVITAAHCFVTLKGLEKLKPGKLYDTRANGMYRYFHGILGDHNRNVKTKYEKSVRFSHLIIHPKLFMSMTGQAYDVVMLKLNEKIVPNEEIGFACLPANSNDTVPTNQKCMAVGWGNTRPVKPFPIWAYEFFDFNGFGKRGRLQSKRVPLMNDHKRRMNRKERRMNREKRRMNRQKRRMNRQKRRMNQQKKRQQQKRRYRRQNWQEKRRRYQDGQRYFPGRRRNAIKLQEVMVTVRNINRCREQYPFSNLRDKIHLCAGANKKDTCSGDSGGGLFCPNKLGRWQLTGITSFGSTRGCGNANGVYMKITSVIDWINNVIKKYD